MEQSLVYRGRLPEPSVDEVSLKDLLMPLFRHRRLLITSFAVVFALTLAIILSQGREYRSSMQFLLNRERIDPLVSAEATTQTGAAKPPITEEEINSEVELLRSQDLLEEVARANGLQNAKQGGLLGWLSQRQAEATRLEKAVTRLGQDLQVKSIPKSNVLQVTYTAHDPKTSFSILNSLGPLYIEKHVAVHRVPGSYAFFAAETQRYQEAMEEAEARLRDFGQEHQVAAPDLERAGMATQVTEAIGQMHLAEQAVAADRSRIGSDEARLASTDKRITTTQATTPANMLVQQLGADIVKAQAKRSELALKYNSDYPLVREADEEVATAKEAFDRAEKAHYLAETTDTNPIYQMLRQDIEKAQSDLAAQLATIQASRSSIDSMQSKMVSLDDASLKQKDLMREAKSAEDNYLLYLAKREQERASDALDKIGIANVAIVESPLVPALPVPRVAPAPVLAFGVALVFSLILTYLAAYLDPSVHEPKDVSELLGIPFVVTVPMKAA